MLRLFYNKGGIMLYLSFALYKEAEPFIKELRLKAENRCKGFQVFSNENVKLVINGSGNIPAAVNLTDFFSGERISKDDYFINIGSCASPSANNLNQIFLCNKIIESSTGRSFYPDVLFNHNFEEAICITSPVPLKNTEHMTSIKDSLLFDIEKRTPVIFDMEATSCYQAAIRYFKTDRMCFIKYVSDTGSDNVISVTPNKVVRKSVFESLYNLFYEIKGIEPSDFSLSDTLAETHHRERAALAAEFLAPLLSCSVTMKHELEKLFLYYACSGKDALEKAKDFADKHNDMLPAHKKQGTSLLAKLKDEILSDDILATDNDATCKIADGVNNAKASLFSHIYVEKQAMDYTLTREILNKFKNSTVIYINHYKDIFNRSNQNFSAQKSSPALILAVNNGERIYEGARTCQNFGHEHFYYTSQIKNCIYDCEYCFLQGMYPSGNICMFVNTEDYFSDVDLLLKEHPVSLSISYDTDMSALDGITGLISKWCDFAAHRPELTVEIRTKCGSVKPIKDLTPVSNVIFAFTISPNSVAKCFEHGASGYEQRKLALYTTLKNGFTARLSIDPILPVEDFDKQYTEMIEDIFSKPVAANIADVSIGSFRISREYIKQMQDVRLNRITSYPYTIKDGICGFDDDTQNEMLENIKKSLLKYISEDKLFIAE